MKNEHITSKTQFASHLGVELGWKMSISRQIPIFRLTWGRIGMENGICVDLAVKALSGMIDLNTAFDTKYNK